MSRLLLDTHAPLWFVSNDSALSTSARSLIEDANEVFVSVASAWETAIKAHLGKLTLDAASVEGFFEEQMRTNDFTYCRSRPRMCFERRRSHFTIAIHSIARKGEGARAVCPRRGRRSGKGEAHQDLRE